MARARRYARGRGGSIDCDRRKRPRGVLEIRNSRSYRNVCVVLNRRKRPRSRFHGSLGSVQAASWYPSRLLFAAAATKARARAEAPARTQTRARTHTQAKALSSQGHALLAVARKDDTSTGCYIYIYIYSPVLYTYIFYPVLARSFKSSAKPRKRRVGTGESGQIEFFDHLVKRIF